MLEIQIPSDVTTRRTACELLFRHLPSAAAAQQTNYLLRLFDSGEMSSAGLALATQFGDPCGASFVQLVPGTAIVLPPRVKIGYNAKPIEDLLLHHTIGLMVQAGSPLGQAFLEPQETDTATALTRNGFVAVTTLLHLVWSKTQDTPPLRSGNDLAFIRCGKSQDLAFGEVLKRTYEHSLDVPEAFLPRSVEELIAGYRATQRGQESWWLLRHGRDDVGVLLLGQDYDGGYWEVTYLGILPEQRQRGYGHAAIEFAIQQAQERNATGITLSVDRRNVPALQIYQSLRFQVYQEQQVFLWRGSV